MSETAARFEFRAFARNFGIVEDRLRAWADVDRIRESDEIYLVSPACTRHNIKYRGGLLDIKVLVAERDGLQQWTPHAKVSFPLARDWLARELAPPLGLPVGPLPERIGSAKTLVEQLVYPHPEVLAVRVFKRRFAFSLEGCLCELAEVEFNSAALATACIESTDAQAVATLRTRLGLDDYPNTSYLTALRQLTGLDPIPLPWD